MNPTNALLGLLIQGEKHGYELKSTVDADFAPFWQIDFAQLYRSLAKMKRADWITPHVAPGKGGPERKMYQLTPKGRRVFEEWVQTPAADRNEFFTKLRLATSAGITIDPMVAAERETLETERAARQGAFDHARDTRDAGQIMLADAALRETEAALAALQLWSNTPSSASPSSGKTLAARTVITGSDDPLLSFLAQKSGAAATAVGSLAGLLILARHEADIAGVHLLDMETGEYNVPFVKHLMPEDATVLVNLAFRENGLMLARGNPKKIRGVRDLTRDEIHFVNRQRGAGTRLLLFSELRKAGVNPRALNDWENALTTHEAVAAAITSERADAGPGLEAIADEWNLDFIPLGEERYDLVTPQEVYESGRLDALLQVLDSAAFRQRGARLRGYDLSRSGQVVARIK